MRKLSGISLAWMGVAVLAVAFALPFVVLGVIGPRAPVIAPIAAAQYANLPGAKVRYENVGSGSRAILLLHGFNGQLANWQPTWDLLHGCELRHVRLDLPGYGLSTADIADYSLAAQAAHVIAFLDALGIETAIVVGESMGGSLAAWLAAYYPSRIERVALLAPSGYIGALRYPGLFGRLLKPGALHDGALAIARSALYARLFPASKALQALTVTASYGSPWVTALNDIRAPTVIVWSTGDTGVSYTTATQVQRHIADSRVVWLDGATGHLIPRTRPELTAKLVCELGGMGTTEQVVAALAPLLKVEDRAPAQ